MMKTLLLHGRHFAWLTTRQTGRISIHRRWSRGVGSGGRQAGLVGASLGVWNGFLDVVGGDIAGRITEVGVLAGQER